jgi:hypothetical protein
VLPALQAIAERNGRCWVFGADAIGGELILRYKFPPRQNRAIDEKQEIVKLYVSEEANYRLIGNAEKAVGLGGILDYILGRPKCNVQVYASPQASFLLLFELMSAFYFIGFEDYDFMQNAPSGQQGMNDTSQPKRDEGERAK